MISFAFKKILKNKLLYFGLLLSMIIMITVSCLVPMFYSALLGRMLLMNFNDKTTVDDKYSNLCTYQIAFKDWHLELIEKEKYFSNRIENELVKQFMQPIAYENKIYTSKDFSLVELTGHADDALELYSFKAYSFKNYSNTIDLFAGEYPSAQIGKDGVFEAAISNDTAQIYGLVMGRTYSMSSISTDTDFSKLKIKISGLFNPKTGGASAIENPISFEHGIMCDEAVFRKLFIENASYLHDIRWQYMLDYTKADMNDYNKINAAHLKQTLEFKDLQTASSQNSFKYDGVKVFAEYFPLRNSLIRLILVLTLPMLMLLLFSIFFISKLIVEGDKNEISVLQSRGAKTYQISQIYLIQCAFLVLIPVIISPFLAVGVCKLMGNTSGFLEFADNIALGTAISLPVILSGLLAALISIITIIIPAAMASKTNIIFRKQKAADKSSKPFWQKFYLDFAMLAVSAYGYYTFLQRQKLISEQNISGNSVPIDPLSFVIVILFIISSGMIFMRIFPLIIKFVTKTFNSKWPTSFYTAVQRVILLQSREQFVILLLILTFSFGVFSANSARTINKNTDNAILYGGGADMTINLVPTNLLTPDDFESKPTVGHFSDLKGIEAVTIVSLANNVQVYSNMEHNTIPIQMRGVDVQSFADVIREGGFMKDKHINYYLNMLAADLHGAIISKTLADEMGYKVGDTIQVNPDEKGMNKGSQGLTLKVVAIVDTWPAYPYSIAEEETADETKEESAGKITLDSLIVVNTEILEDEYLDVSYRVWLRKTDEASIQSVRTQLKKKFLGVYEVKDYISEVNYSRNSAERQSINSLLTLNFAVIFIICLVGFLMYWVLSIRSRVIQFGFFRAIGMSTKSIYAMLIYEQVFITLSSAAFSILLGGFASRAFMGILKITFGAKEQMMPFTFLSSADDFLKIYLILVFMIAITYTTIAFQIKSLNIGRTIKLGEE